MPGERTPSAGTAATEPATTRTAGARRLTTRGAATRERIVSAAADLMYRQGVGATSLDEVIEASGTGKSQLYHYFTDKDALVTDVVSTQIDRVLGFQDDHLRRMDSLAGLERWRDAIVTGVQARGGGHGCPLGSLAAGLADHSDTARTALADAFGVWERLLADGLERMRADGRLHPDTDPAALATALLAALQGGLLLAQTRRDPAPLRIALDMALDHVRVRSCAGRFARGAGAAVTE